MTVVRQSCYLEALAVWTIVLLVDEILFYLIKGNCFRTSSQVIYWIRPGTKALDYR